MSAEGGKSPGELCVGHETRRRSTSAPSISRASTRSSTRSSSPIWRRSLWAPHGHWEAVDSLSPWRRSCCSTPSTSRTLRLALRRVTESGRQAYVVDLAWLRSTPWRERVATMFDPKPWREELRRISAVKARHHPESGVAGVLFFGWLASRLGWQPGSLLDTGGVLHGKALLRRQEVELRLEPDPRQSVRGLAGVSIETASGMSISLDRAPGGLRATRRTHDGRESQWTLLGASRGEGGILGEGVRQALLRDPTYRPALDAARAMVG